jgi:hypothetical protein
MMQHWLAIKMKEVLIHAATRMNLENNAKGNTSVTKDYIM